MGDESQNSAAELPAKTRNSPFVRERVSEERWQCFLANIRKYGFVKIAAQIASQHLDSPDRTGSKTQNNSSGGMSGGMGSFAYHIRHDPIRREQYLQACADGRSILEKIARERMEMPDERPVLNKAGQIVAVEKRWESANRILLRGLQVLSRGDPEGDWNPQLELSGKIQHEHSVLANDAAFRLTTEDISFLPREKQMILLNLISEIEDNKTLSEDAEIEQKALPAPEIASTRTEAAP